MKALVNGRIFADQRWLDDQALLIEEDRITGLAPLNAVPAGYEEEDLEGDRLLPGFIDIQVNGGGGILLNDAKSIDDLQKIIAAHRQYGTTGMLPTLITDSWDRMQDVAALIREAITIGMPGILGIHFEGPYLNAERKGVHNPAMIRAVDEGFFKMVTAGDLGAVVVTLAPEKVPLDIIRKLSTSGVHVSAGHSAVGYEEAKVAMAAGLKGVTHLYNGMPPMESRNPGLIGAALTASDCYCGVIVDGHHVHPGTLKATIAAKGADRIFLVTDAMSSVGTEMSRFQLGETKIKIEGGKLTTEDGILAGSNLDMASAVRNTVSLLGQTFEDAVNMATSVPAHFLGQKHKRGSIKAGYQADLIRVDEDMKIIKSWIAGRS